MNKINAIIGGAGLGLLIGLLIGLSTVGTVGLIIGALSSALLVLLGLKGNEDGQNNALRIGAFGIFCAAAVLTGLYLRVNDSFAPSIESEIDKWTSDNNFSKEEAKKYFLYEKFGFIPSEAIRDTSVNVKKNQTVLYNAEVSFQDCEKLKGYENFQVEEELLAYEKTGGVWERVAKSVKEEVDANQQKEVLHLIRKCLCDE